jgi:hypothetical protein
MANIIHSGGATMPLTISYVPQSDTEQVLQLSGTASAGKANQKIGFTMSVNGSEIMTSSIYSKTPNENRTTAVSHANHTFPFTIKEGEVQPVTIKIELMSGSEFDSNDTVGLIIV